MNEFCRIIQLDEGQVLLVMTFDDDADDEDGYYKVHQTTEYNDAQMTAISGYSTVEKQLYHFANFSKEEAQMFFNQAKKLLS